MFWTTAVLLVTLACARVNTLTKVGAPDDVNINTPAVQDALNFAVGEHNKQSNDAYTSKVVKVITAQRQVCVQTFSSFSFSPYQLACIPEPVAISYFYIT